MTAVPGQIISTPDHSALPPICPPSELSRTAAAELPARIDGDPIVARLETGAGNHIGPYRQIDTSIDQKTGTFWCHLRPDGAPSFNHGILRELAHMQRAIMRLFD